jgi:hypothetical protein
MAIVNSIQVKQGILSIGSNPLISYPRGFQGSVSFLFNNPIAYDIEINVTRVSNGTTVQLYALSLDPGDTVNVTELFLFPGDSIAVVTSVAGTSYQMSYSSVPFAKIP